MEKMNSFINLFLLTSIFFINSFVYSQVTQEWVQRYHGTKSLAEARALISDNNGNIYVTGYCDNINTNNDLVTIKYNMNGQSQWVATYSNGSEWEGGQAIVADKYGNVYVTGDANGTNGFITIKYNSAGVQQWAKRYLPNKMSSPKDICLDSSGNIYVTGFTSTPYYNFDVVTIKYNSLGDEKWVRVYQQFTDSSEAPCAIAYNGSNGIYIGGYSISAQNHVCFLLIRYDTLGNNYMTSFGTWGVPSAMYLDNTGNIYLAGEDGGSYVTQKIYANGTQWWYRTYQRTGGFCSAKSITVDKQGNVYVTGVAPAGPANNDIGTIKYNSAGVQQWVAIYNGPANANDAGNSVAVDTSGNIYVTGYASGIGTGYDFGTIKYSPTGQQVWSILYNGPSNGGDEPFLLNVDKTGNVIVCGRSPGIDTIYEFTTVKYSQLTGINNISQTIPDKFFLYQNYPNPFNPSTKIKFDVSPLLNPLLQKEGNARSAGVVLKIYDILGKEIATLVNEPLSPGSYEVEWNASDYTSGIYFYTLQTETVIQTKKMVLLK